MRKHGLSQCAQYVIAKVIRTDETASTRRRGVTLATLNERQLAAEAKAQERAEELRKAL